MGDYLRGLLFFFLTILVIKPVIAEEEDPIPNERARPSTRVTVTEEDETNTSYSTKSKKPPRIEGKYFSTWSPEMYKYAIGYESGGSSNAVLGANNVVIGFWFPGDFGLDFYVGYTKAAGTANEETTVNETGTTTKTKVTTKDYSGLSGANNMTFGLGLKMKGYQNSWFQFSYGIIAAYGGASRVEGRVGTIQETVPDTASPTTKTSVETNYGTIVTDTKSTISVGPKLGAEFYLKWFPHLALGFSTGVLATFGGETTATTTTRSRTTVTVSGTEQPNTSGTDGPTTVTSSTTPGYSARTFGIGGTQFQFNGLFTIRYVW